MQKHLTLAGLILALGTFVVAEQPRMHSIEAAAQSQGSALQITQQPRVEYANDNSATIAWSTNVQAGSVVKYGSDPNNLSQTAQAPWGGVTHRVQLKNLQPNTTYYYQAVSRNAQGSGADVTSSVEQFRTGGNGQQAQYGSNMPATTAQNTTGAQDNIDIVAGPVVQNMTPASADLWWQTNNTAANDVKYGTDPNNMSQRAYEPGGSREHRAQLTDLQPGRTYYYEIMRRNGTVRTTGQFTTPGQTPTTMGNAQITNGPVLSSLGPNSATVTWSTSAPASSMVRYGTDPNALTQTAQAPWGSTTHNVTLNNLQPNTRYYFEVISSQTQGNGGMAQSTGQFMTMQQGQQAMTFPQH